MTGIIRKHLCFLGLLIGAVMAALGLSSGTLSSSPALQPPPPKEIRLSTEDKGRLLQLHDAEVLVISLETNPSTGYGWEVEQASLSAQGSPILVRRGDEVLTPEMPAPSPLGAPATQVLRFQAIREGKTSLRLVYRRPWEGAPPSDIFSLQVEAIGPFLQPPTTLADGTAEIPTRPSGNLEAARQAGLPPAFNWCNLGACTAIKDQGSCGSCWAFSTVGPLESSILYQHGIERDLSEQYLLSCNTDGWNCSGGWFAHDYHEWKIPLGEPGAGAVYEAEFPYTARRDRCNPPHTHYERIVEWNYVADSGSIPPVGAIKQAIWDYGPVSVAIRVGSAFRNYTGGIFETDETGELNHAVVLAGWDDTQGTNGIWLLRNSWGPAWGEDGYMRIGYGISSVGYAANYIVNQPSCFDLETQGYPAGTGTVAPDPAPNCGNLGYLPGTVVELSPIASPGWHFFTWAGDASGTSNPLTITMDTDWSIDAHFMCDECSLRQRLVLVMVEYERE